MKRFYITDKNLNELLHKPVSIIYELKAIQSEVENRQLKRRINTVMIELRNLRRDALEYVVVNGKADGS